MSPVPSTASAPASISKRLVLLLMSATSAGYVCRVAVTVVAPNMMREFGLTQAQMGTVFSAFLVGYTFFQVPSGGLADRVSARRIFVVLCAGWAVLTVLTALVGWRGWGLAMVIPQLWIIRALFGVIAAPTYPTSGRTIAITVPPRLQARVNSLVLASVGIGSAITPLLLAPVTSRYGWRTALWVAAALSAAAGISWWWLGPRELHGGNRAGEPVSPPAESESRAAAERPLRSPSFWFLSASYLLQGYLGYIFIFWFYLYLVQVRHFEVLRAASFTALPWIATMFAIPLGGVLSDWAVIRWGATWGRRSVPLAALCAAAIFLVIGARTARPLLAVAALTTCTVLVLCTEGPFWATMTQLSGEHSGIAGGTMNFGSNLGGMVSPALTPWLAERIGWETALTLTAGLAIVAGLLWLGVRMDANEP
ncbi:MAG TPA: MFS transporter [Candidatus Sulfotelmatobacter sp.]|nr:MFS transporter [Candidatus Sulfotelmatobacter sp.]